jgi:hypothetical protein
MDVARAGRCTVARAEPGGGRGWRSLYYHQREPALSVELCCDAADAKLITVFAPKSYQVRLKHNRLEIESGDEQIEADLSHGHRLISQARILGKKVIDRLVVPGENPAGNH